MPRALRTLASLSRRGTEESHSHHLSPADQADEAHSDLNFCNGASSRAAAIVSQTCANDWSHCHPHRDIQILIQIRTELMLCTGEYVVNERRPNSLRQHEKHIPFTIHYFGILDALEFPLRMSINPIAEPIPGLNPKFRKQEMNAE